MTRKQAAAELGAAPRARIKEDDGVPAGYMPRRLTPGARWAIPAPSDTAGQDSQ